MRIYILFLFSLAFLACSFLKPEKLKPVSKTKIDIPEPSDICPNADGSGYFVVSDNGFLAEISSDGKMLRKASFEGTDFEACFLKGDTLAVADERSREVHFFNPKTLERLGSREVPYPGGRNKGFEAICFNNTRNAWQLFSEKDPIWLFELDRNWLVSKKDKIKGLSDLSSATWHEGKLWLLSDEDHAVFCCHPKTLDIEKKWSIPVINPEGICFNTQGELLVVSDDMGILFNFGKVVNQ